MKNTIPIADVAHVVRNALVPARFNIERIRDQALDARFRERATRALTGIVTVLEFVDGLVERAHDPRREAVEALITVIRLAVALGAATQAASCWACGYDPHVRVGQALQTLLAEHPHLVRAP